MISCFQLQAHANGLMNTRVALAALSQRRAGHLPGYRASRCTSTSELIAIAGAGWRQHPRLREHVAMVTHLGASQQQIP
jgi:hypothetical protein